MSDNDFDKALGAKGLAYLWKRIVDYVNGVIPTRTSQLQNDAGFITDFSELPPDQRENLRGPQGIQGPQGDKGDPGQPGRGITGISKTGTSGLVDTYTGTYSDGSSFQFQVTNGKDGANAADTGIDYSKINNAPHIPAALSELSEDVDHRTVSDAEKMSWSNKSNFSGSYNDLFDAPDFKTINHQSIIGTGDIEIQGGGEAQVQADWEQNDNTQPDYIKNKPDVYSKPSTGIPSTDLSSAVQTSLGKADNAVPNTRTVNGKALSSNISLDASDVGALPSSTPIPVVPTNVSAFTNDAGYITASDISGKEDKVDIVSASGTTLLAEVGKYYTLSNVGTLAITLPTIAAGTTKVQTVTFYIAAGSTPAVTWTSTHTIIFADGFQIDANGLYEISAAWNGIGWIVGMLKLVAPSS